MIFHFGTSHLMCQNKLLGVVGGVLGRNASLIFQKLFTGKSVFLINQFTFWNFSNDNTIKCIFAHRSWDEAKVGCNAVHYIQGAFVELRWGGGDSWVRRRPLCSDPLNLRAVPQRVSHPDDTTPVQKGQTLVLREDYEFSRTRNSIQITQHLPKRGKH